MSDLPDLDARRAHLLAYRTGLGRGHQSLAALVAHAEVPARDEDVRLASLHAHTALESNLLGSSSLRASSRRTCRPTASPPSCAGAAKIMVQFQPVGLEHLNVPRPHVPLVKFERMVCRRFLGELDQRLPHPQTIRHVVGLAFARPPTKLAQGRFGETAGFSKQQSRKHMTPPRHSDARLVPRTCARHPC